MREGYEGWRDYAELIAGNSGAVFVGITVAGSIARLVPGAYFGHNLAKIGAAGVVLLAASYLVRRSPLLLLSRASLVAPIALLFSVLMVLPAIIRSPTDPLAWVLVVVFSSVHALLLKAAPRIRSAIEGKFQ